MREAVRPARLFAVQTARLRVRHERLHAEGQAAHLRRARASRILLRWYLVSRVSGGGHASFFLYFPGPAV